MSDENVKNGGLDVEVEEDMEDKSSQFYVYYITALACIGGLLFGYDTGIISGSMLLIGDNWKLSSIWKEGIVGATIGAAAVFALIAGFLSDWMGRKKVIMLASVVFTIGAVVMGASPNKELLLVGRLIVGAGIGFASMSVPVYVAEAAPAHIRGRLVTINQLCITIGILASSVIAGLFSVNKENGWRYMLGIAGVPSIVQFIGFLWLPESPRWLVEKGREDEARKLVAQTREYMLGIAGVPSIVQFIGFLWLPESPRWLVEKGREDEARKALKQIRKTVKIDKELTEIVEAVRIQRKRSSSGQGQIATVVRMLKTQPVRRALVLGCGIQMFAQLSGINTVIYYSASILKLAGFPVELAIWLVCVPNAVNCLCTFIGIWLVERAGRRILTLASMIGVMIGLLVLAIGFQLSIIYTPEIKVTELNSTYSYCAKYNLCENCITDENCGFCYVKDSPASTGSCLNVYDDKPERYAAASNLTTFRCNKTSTWDTPRSERTMAWADSFCPTDYSWMAVLGLALFVMGFAPGLGPMPWTVNSEIYPTWARSTGNALATTTNWTFNLFVSLTFLTLMENITKYGVFYFYLGICCIGFTFLFFLLKETKNKTLEEVQELFMSKKYKAKVTRERQLEDEKNEHNDIKKNMTKF